MISQACPLRLPEMPPPFLLNRQPTPVGYRDKNPRRFDPPSAVEGISNAARVAIQDLGVDHGGAQARRSSSLRLQAHGRRFARRPHNVLLVAGVAVDVWGSRPVGTGVGQAEASTARDETGATADRRRNHFAVGETPMEVAGQRLIECTIDDHHRRRASVARDQGRGAGRISRHLHERRGKTGGG